MTLVVGGVLPSMPIRTPFTPALPTEILFCALARTVSGSSTRTRSGDVNFVSLGVTAWVELISIWMPSPPGTTLTFCNWLCCAEDWDVFVTETTFGAGTGFVTGVAASGLEDGITAGFPAGAAAPGAGLAFAGTPAACGAAVLSLACFCCSDFAVLRALSMASEFCAPAAAQELPVIIAIARMPVVSFITVPTSPPAFPVWSRRQPLKVANRD